MCMDTSEEVWKLSFTHTATDLKSGFSGKIRKTTITTGQKKEKNMKRMIIEGAAKRLIGLSFVNVCDLFTL